MTRPRRFLVRMTLFVLAVIVGVAMLFIPLREAFMANAPLNGLIVGVFLIGIAFNFRQVLSLYPEVNWIESFRSEKPALSQARPPRLLAPMATMLGEHRDRLRLSALAMRSVLDSIASRLDESRDISRYMIGLMIFLGLLGTFWGLLQTVAAVSDVIGGLSVSADDFSTMFLTLKEGLAAPLKGMGTAFSSSLFGLAGSLVLGFLDLQAGQAQNRFLNDLEEWLSSVTRLQSGAFGGEGGGDQPIPVYVQALLEQTAESLDTLQRTLTRSEEGRGAMHHNMLSLTEKLGALTDQMQVEQKLLLRLAEGQSELKPVLGRLAEATEKSGGGGMDEATRTHIRNLDVYMARLMEDLSVGRDEVVSQVRSEIKLLARTIAALAESGEQR